MKPFEIFRTGRLTSSNGDEITFSAADMADVVSSYDPALHQAPLVVGHPKTNAPAFGWVKGLAVKGDRLVAEPERLDPTFSEMVKDGKFPKVSVALYSPSSKGNPTPGKYHLRHVGFLGAEPPAVKGLAPIEFSEGDDDVLTFGEIAFDPRSQLYFFETVTRVLKAMRERLVARDGIQAADEVVTAWDLDTLTQGAADLRAELGRTHLVATFSETEETPMTTAQKTEAERAAALAAREAEIASREAAISARELTFSEAEKKTRATEDAAFVTSIVEAGRLPIGLKETAIALFSEMSEDVLTFSEGGAEVRTSPREAFRGLLEKLPVPVVTGELAAGDGPDFSDPAGVQLAIETEMREAAAKGQPSIPPPPQRASSAAAKEPP